MYSYQNCLLIYNQQSDANVGLLEVFAILHKISFIWPGLESLICVEYVFLKMPRIGQ
jgi:hypothetical protein